MLFLTINHCTLCAVTTAKAVYWLETNGRCLGSRAVTLPMCGNYKEETGIQNCATQSPEARLTGTNWKLSNGLLVCLRAPSVSSVLWHLRSRAAVYWPTVCVWAEFWNAFLKRCWFQFLFLCFFFPMTDDWWRLYIQSFDPTLPSKCTQNQITKTRGMMSDKRKEGS